MTECDLGPGSTDRRQHEDRMEKWSGEWLESNLWQLDEPCNEDTDVISNYDTARARSDHDIKAPRATACELTEEDFHW